MANKGKDTNTSQFFMLYRQAPHLNRKHTIFGRVVGGLDVLAKMEAVETDGSDRPLNKITIRDVVVYVDPFVEFQKQKNERDRAAEARAAVERRGDDVAASRPSASPVHPPHEVGTERTCTW